MPKKQFTTPALEAVIEERRHQIEDLGHTMEKDDLLVNGELLTFVSYFVMSNEDNFPKNGWNKDYLKQVHLKPRIEQLQIANAVLTAEIDRRKRLANVSIQNS